MATRTITYSEALLQNCYCACELLYLSQVNNLLTGLRTTEVFHRVMILRMNYMGTDV